MMQNRLADRQGGSQCKKGQVGHTSGRGYKASSERDRKTWGDREEWQRKAREDTEARQEKLGQ